MFTRKSKRPYFAKVVLCDGLSVVEIIVAAAVIVTIVTAAAASWQVYLRTSNTSVQQSQAAIIVEETSEVLRLFRDQSWTSFISPLSLNTLYQLNFNGTGYTITTNQILVQNKFVRTFSLSAVSRDSSDNIITSGGTNDPNSRKVSISVFLPGATSTPIMQTEMLLQNVYAN